MNRQKTKVHPMKMYRFLLLFLCLGMTLPVGLRAANLVLFSESNDEFELWIDGMRMGNYPSNHFKITDLPSGDHRIRFQWPNPRFQPYETTLMVNPETEATYALVWDSRRNYSLIFVSEVNMNYHVQPPQSITVLPYAGIPASGNPHGNHPHHGQNPQGNGGVFMPGEVVVPMGDPSGGSTTTTTTTTTIITTNEPVVDPVVPVPLPPNPLPGYNGRIGCDGGLVANDINEVTQTLKKQSFESTRVTLAKQIISSRCLLVSQVIAILNQFTFESNKVDLAKYAYGYTYDRDNYFKVNDVFTFSSSVDELAKYIQSRP
jgi:hypothetical protein